MRGMNEAWVVIRGPRENLAADSLFPVPRNHRLPALPLQAVSQPAEEKHRQDVDGGVHRFADKHPFQKHRAILCPLRDADLHEQNGRDSKADQGGKYEHKEQRLLSKNAARIAHAPITAMVAISTT